MSQQVAICWISSISSKTLRRQEQSIKVVNAVYLKNSINRSVPLSRFFSTYHDSSTTTAPSKANASSSKKSNNDTRFHQLPSILPPTHPEKYNIGHDLFHNRSSSSQPPDSMRTTTKTFLESQASLLLALKKQRDRSLALHPTIPWMMSDEQLKEEEEIAREQKKKKKKRGMIFESFGMNEIELRMLLLKSGEKGVIGGDEKRGIVPNSNDCPSASPSMMTKSRKSHKKSSTNQLSDLPRSFEEAIQSNQTLKALSIYKQAKKKRVPVASDASLYYDLVHQSTTSKTINPNNIQTVLDIFDVLDEYLSVSSSSSSSTVPCGESDLRLYDRLCTFVIHHYGYFFKHSNENHGRQVISQLECLIGKRFPCPSLSQEEDVAKKNEEDRFGRHWCVARLCLVLLHEGKNIKNNFWFWRKCRDWLERDEIDYFSDSPLLLTNDDKDRKLVFEMLDMCTRKAQQFISFDRLLKALIDAGHTPQPQTAIQILDCTCPFFNPVAVKNTLSYLLSMIESSTHPNDDYQISFGTLQYFSSAAARWGDADMAMMCMDLADRTCQNFSSSSAALPIYEDAMCAFAWWGISSLEIDGVGENEVLDWNLRKNGHLEALKLLAEMENLGFVPSAQVVDSLGRAFGKNNRRLSNVYNLLIHHTPGTSLTTSSMNCILSGCSNLGLDYWALDIFRKFTAPNPNYNTEGIKPNRNTFAYLMRSTAIAINNSEREHAELENRMSNVEYILELLDQHTFTTPDSIAQSYVLHHLIQIMCLTDDTDGATVTLRSVMSSSSSSGSREKIQSVTFVVLATKLAENGRFDCARELVMEGQKMGYEIPINLMGRIRNIEMRMKKGFQ